MLREGSERFFSQNECRESNPKTSGVMVLRALSSPHRRSIGNTSGQSGTAGDTRGRGVQANSALSHAKAAVPEAVMFRLARVFAYQPAFTLGQTAGKRPARQAVRGFEEARGPWRGPFRLKRAPARSAEATAERGYSAPET
jgi:hypothetical protein